jgi:hypothetical protein
VLVRAVLLALLALCAAAAPAAAEPVLVVGEDGAVVRDDPVLPPDALATTPPPGGERSCAASAPVAVASARTVGSEVRRVARAGAITAAQSDDYLAAYRRARSAARGLGGQRGNELRAVIRGVESLARRRLLTSTRMPAAFLQLRRNTEFWRKQGFPKAPVPKRKPCTGAAGLGGARVTFAGDPVVFQWYPGQGLQIQPLANFGKANALWRACAEAPATNTRASQTPTPPPTGGTPVGTPTPTPTPAPTATPCRPDELRALLDRMVALASERGGFTAWEYFFAFGGGTPPWISGLAQGTAIQALTRGSQLLSDPKYVAVARRGIGAFERRPPLGVRVGSTSGTGHHYLIYSFSTGLRVLNGFLQSLVGLHDYAASAKDRRALRLFRDGDRAARREIGRYDTGAWSLYSLGGNESDLGYHRLVRDFLDSLCERTNASGYCAPAKRFERYLHERTRVGFSGVGGARAGRVATIRFTLSKLSCVTLRIRRGKQLVHVRKLVLPRGLRGLTYAPPRRGRYTVQVQAVDLLNHYTRVERPWVVRPRKART